MSNPLKHARTEVDSDPADQLIANSTCHSEFWFDDGSIVLNVQTTLFRVHRSTLSMHSTVFSDMFSIPQPPDQNVIEGCPIVHLHNSAEDFACLLKALYNPFYFAGSSVDELIPFDDVTAILRLSNKYDIQPFRQKSIQELKKVFPCTLLDHDSIYPAGKTYTVSCSKTIQSILLARACNTLELLPCIFYYMCQFPTNIILQCHAIFPRTEMNICLLGREKQQEMRETIILTLVLNHKPPLHCLNPTRCKQQCIQILSHAISKRFHANTRALTTDPGLTDTLRILCCPCEEEKLSAHQAVREKVWNDLPSYFGLGTWEELRSGQK